MYGKYLKVSNAFLKYQIVWIDSQIYRIFRLRLGGATSLLCFLIVSSAFQIYFCLRIRFLDNLRCYLYKFEGFSHSPSSRGNAVSRWRLSRKRERKKKFKQTNRPILILVVSF